MAMPQPAYELDDLRTSEPTGPSRSRSRARTRASLGDVLARLATILLCLLHGWAIWRGVGGREGLEGDWPILIADHGFHFHHGVVTRNFLVAKGISAGYDPSFMSGYPMSVITGTSSTLTNLAILGFGKDRPAVAFKVLTFLADSSLPWWVVLAAIAFGAGPRSVALASRALPRLFLDRLPGQLCRVRHDLVPALGPDGPAGGGLAVELFRQGWEAVAGWRRCSRAASCSWST